MLDYKCFTCLSYFCYSYDHEMSPIYHIDNNYQSNSLNRDTPTAYHKLIVTKYGRDGTDIPKQAWSPM